MNRLEHEFKEEKVLREQQISKLENEKADLQKRIENLESARSLKINRRSLVSSSNVKAALVNVEKSNKAFVGRSCQDLKSNDPSLVDGFHDIDPDGDGEGAFQVYCNMIDLGILTIS